MDVYVSKHRRTPKYLVLCTYSMIMPLITTLVISQASFILHLKSMDTDLFTLNVIECIAYSIDHKLTWFILLFLIFCTNSLLIH